MQKGLDRAGTVRDAWLTPLLEKFVLTRSEARELGWRSPEQVFHLPWGSLLGVSESARAEFSFSTPSAPPSTYTFKLIGHVKQGQLLSLIFLFSGVGLS